MKQSWNSNTIWKKISVVEYFFESLNLSLYDSIKDKIDKLDPQKKSADVFQVSTLSHRILFCLLNTFYQQFLYSMSFVYLLSSLFFKEGILFLFMREKREATTFFTIHIFLQIVFIIIFTIIIFIVYIIFIYIDIDICGNIWCVCVYV